MSHARAFLHVNSVPFLVTAVTAALQPPHPSLSPALPRPTTNRMFCPPPTFLTHSRHPPTSIYRRPSPHGPSCPCPSRPMPFRIRHVSPTTRSALPTCLSDCACQLPCYRIHTILPLRLMRTPSSTCTLFPLCISHHLPHITSAFTLTGRTPLRTSVLYFPPQSSPSRHVARIRHAAHCRRSARRTNVRSPRVDKQDELPSPALAYTCPCTSAPPIDVLLPRPSQLTAIECIINCAVNIESISNLDVASNCSIRDWKCGNAS